MTDRVAIVGTGADPDDPDSDGFAMAYRHAAGYERVDGCEVVACADVVPENAEAFADAHDLPAGGVYEDYRRLLREVAPDLVSVCVPPDVHAEIVVGCADVDAGAPDAIHCEKPMATTWADCRRMADACADAGIQLTIDHQRRVGPIFRRAKALLADGAIGDLRRVEWSAKNLFDAGTHLFDLSTFYTDGADAEWMLCGLDYREENRWFGVHNENQAVAQWRYASGVDGLAVTGAGADAIDPYVALDGTAGRIEVGASAGPPLRYRADDGDGWVGVDVGENVWGDVRRPTWQAGLALAARRAPLVSPSTFGLEPHPSHVERAIAEVVDAYRSGRPSELRAAQALRGTELIFAAYESVRSRGRVDLPLSVDDNPLASMVEAGQVPVGAD